MLESPAFQVLSRAARQILHRLEIEHMHHGGEENGALKCTYKNFVQYGIHLAGVASAIRELEALGFLEVTERGCGGNSDERNPNLYRLTYLRAKGADNAGTHEWQTRAQTIDEAEAIAKRARSDIDQLLAERGRRQAARRAPDGAELQTSQ